MTTATAQSEERRVLQRLVDAYDRLDATASGNAEAWHEARQEEREAWVEARSLLLNEALRPPEVSDE